MQMMMMLWPHSNTLHHFSKVLTGISSHVFISVTTFIVSYFNTDNHVDIFSMQPTEKNSKKCVCVRKRRVSQTGTGGGRESLQVLPSAGGPNRWIRWDTPEGFQKEHGSDVHR